MIIKHIKRLYFYIKRIFLYGIFNSIDLFLKKSTGDIDSYALKMQDIRKNLLKRGLAIYDLELMGQIYLGKRLNIEKPNTFCEKIQWMKLYDNNPLRTELTDKYLVKEWISRKLNDSNSVPKLLGVWDKFDDIDFSKLPEEYVLKANHGCHWYIVVDKKNKLNKERAKKQFDTWMKLDYSLVDSYELHYHNIKPKIIAEEKLDSLNIAENEYKFMCFGGKVEYIYSFKVIKEKTGKRVLVALYSREWKQLDWTDMKSDDVCKDILKKPDNLQDMISVAERLSKDFEFVRIDMYGMNDKIYVGEMTFTPNSGFMKFSKPQVDYEMGRLIGGVNGSM